MFRQEAKRAMTTLGQRGCFIIDHLVEALGGEPACSLRRAMVLVDIDQHPGTTQTEIMHRLDIHKSAMNREIEWLFNYGCIRIQDSSDDGRAKTLEVCGYCGMPGSFLHYMKKVKHLNLMSLDNSTEDQLQQITGLIIN